MTDRAPVGMLCRCSDSQWPHRHVVKYIEGPPHSAWLETVREPAPSWRALAREDHDAARAQLLKEIFG